MEEENFK
ncbi:unnamed protein product, partial [Rotaria socialis]